MGSPKVRKFLEGVRSGAISLDNPQASDAYYLDRGFDELLNHPKAQPPSFAYWIKTWWMQYTTTISRKTRRPRSASTILACRKVVSPFLKWLWENNIALRSPEFLEKDDFERYLATFGNRTGQAEKVHQCLKTMTLQMEELKGCPIPPNIFRKVTKPFHQSLGTRDIDWDELCNLEKFIRATPRHGSAEMQHHARLRDLALYAIFLESGMRRSAAANLQVSRIDWRRKVWRYDDKGRFGLEFPIDNIIDRIQAYMEVRIFAKPWKGESDTKFQKRIEKFNAKQRFYGRQEFNPSKKDNTFLRNNWGLPMTPEGVGSILRRWALYLGQDLTPHMLRRARGKQMYRMLNGDIIAVKEFLRHSDVKTTQIYLGLKDAQRRDAILNTSIFGTPKP